MTDVPLFDIPSRPVHEERRAILELIAGDPIHADDRDVIVTAILVTARNNAGTVDMNEVRARLTHPDVDALIVNPRVIGAVVNSLAAHRVLVADGWLVNRDKRGGNYGKPQRRWRLVRRSAAA